MKTSDPTYLFTKAWGHALEFISCYREALAEGKDELGPVIWQLTCLIEKHGNLGLLDKDSMLWELHNLRTQDERLEYERAETDRLAYERAIMEEPS